MFLSGVGSMLPMYLMLKPLGGGSTAADHHQHGGGSGGFFHLSEQSEGELKRRLAQPTGYFDWLRRGPKVADMERELAACKHLRERLKELIQTLKTSTQALEKYVGQLKELVKGRVVGNADSWTQIEVLRDMAKAGNKELDELVGVNYEMLWEELVKVRLVWPQGLDGGMDGY
ncbi:hypothetical protein BC567DRAFT_213680 [Phyllosticta citribraziliensis]